MTRPLRVRAHRMQERGFVPGLPHAVLVPLLEIAAGATLARSRRRSTTAAAAAAATALGAVRSGIDLEDRTVTVRTVAAAALAVTGATVAATAIRGPARVGLLTATGAVIVFELTRRRRIRSAG